MASNLEYIGQEGKGAVTPFFYLLLQKTLPIAW